jgi:hypothetical protein
MNGQVFLAYVEPVMVPTLEAGDFVVMDNWHADKAAGVRDAMEAIGALSCSTSRLTVPTSIENAFANLKALLRAKAERTIDALWDAVGSLLDVFTSAECADYFKVAGYDPDWTGRSRWRHSVGFAPRPSGPPTCGPA